MADHWSPFSHLLWQFRRIPFLNQCRVAVVTWLVGWWLGFREPPWEWSSTRYPHLSPRFQPIGPQKTATSPDLVEAYPHEKCQEKHRKIYRWLILFLWSSFLPLKLPTNWSIETTFSDCRFSKTTPKKIGIRFLQCFHPKWTFENVWFRNGQHDLLVGGSSIQHPAFVPPWFAISATKMALEVRWMGIAACCRHETHHAGIVKAKNRPNPFLQIHFQKLEMDTSF